MVAPFLKAKVDTNQSSIVRQLRKIPGITVESGHDDILVGHRGQTYWFEIKSTCPYRKDGKQKKNAIRPHQNELLDMWTGQYNIVWSLNQILLVLGIIK